MRALPFSSPLALVFLAIANLHQFISGRLQAFVIQPEISSADPLPSRQLIVIKVLPLALGKAKQEYRPGAAPIGNDGAKPPLLPWPGLATLCLISPPPSSLNDRKQVARNRWLQRPLRHA
jgi:hypothetical protein